VNHDSAIACTDGTACHNACATACAPTPAGCARCQSVASSAIPPSTSAVLFGPRDVDAYATLQQALSAANFECVGYGPLLMVRDVKSRLAELASQLDQRLSRYTKSCIQSAYLPAGIHTLDEVLAAMAFAMPLVDMLGHIEHEWVRTALKDNWIFSVFHPIVDIANQTVAGYEALLRARDPSTNQMLGAGQIINACDSLNLLHVLDQRARQSAIRAAAQYLPGNTKVFINFLPNTIYDPEICLRTTMETAAECNVAMDRLVFEVVETQRIPDMNHLVKVLNYYRERGVGTAIDDMGAGFTGLDYVTSLRADYVKLDREFVLTAEQTPAGRIAMDQIIKTSHQHGSKVIAEGIETPAQMALCLNAGVDLLQGFLFARPACPPAAAIFPTPTRQAA
jgi:EAL domain-containing protein (putative c-di-GMP-specific phosphodiesterase class I)